MTPRVYYGWVLVAALGVTETTSWGILYYSFSVFLAPMESELGWSRAAMTGAYSLAILLSGVAAVPVGRWLDAHGPRLLMTAGSCAGVGLLLAWSAVDSLPAFYLLWAGIGLANATVLYEPAFAVAARWFRTRRSQALMVITLMAGLASTIFVPLADWLVHAQGWRPALVTLAVILAVVTVPLHALLLRRRPEDLGLAVDGDAAPAALPAATPATEQSVPLSAALHDPSFAWLVAAFWLYALSNIGVAVHLLPYLTGAGYASTDAALLVGGVGVMQVVGRIIFVPLERRLAPRVMSAAVFALQPVALAVLLLAPAPVGGLVFVALFGASRGATTLLRSLLVVGLYGPARFASIAGIITSFVTVAQAAAPVGVGAAYDATGGYSQVWWALVAVSVLAVGCVAVADRRTHA